MDATLTTLTPLPEGNAGLAAKYPGDAGIGDDPAVVFAPLRGCGSAADAACSGASPIWRLNITEDQPASTVVERRSGGRCPSRTFAVSGVRTRSNTTCSSLRFYAGTAGPRCPDLRPRQAAISATTTRRRANGRPMGATSSSPTSRPRRPGRRPRPALNVYLYHPEQRSNYGDHIYPTGVIGRHRCAAQLRPHFVPRPDFVPELGRWYCFEGMLRTNTPGQRDGRIACWVDGSLIADFPNLRLRDTEELKIDRIGLCFYIADNRLRENRKWHDDVVAATSYIGRASVRLRRSPPARRARQDLGILRCAFRCAVGRAAGWSSAPAARPAGGHCAWLQRLRAFLWRPVSRPRARTAAPGHREMVRACLQISALQLSYAAGCRCRPSSGTSKRCCQAAARGGVVPAALALGTQGGLRRGRWSSQ
jgi:hypothetical protein